MSDGYPYEDRPSKQDVREAVLRYRDAYGVPALKAFMGWLGFRTLADIPGESYQYVIDSLNAEMTDKGEDFVVPASPLPPPINPIDAREAKRRENRRRWAEEARRDKEDRYAAWAAPAGTLTYPRFEPSERVRWPGRKPKAKPIEESVEQKSWVEKRFGVIDV